MKLHFLTTHDDGQTETKHFATREHLEAAVKVILRRELGPDRYRALLAQDLTETPIWNGPDDDLAALRHLFEEELSGNCIDLTWGEFELPASAPATDPAGHEIHRLLTISTAHVPETVRLRLLDPDEGLPMLSCDEHGAWLRTGLDRSPKDMSKDDAATTREWGPALTVVMAYARRLGCAYVRLDADGPEYPDLPTFHAD